MMPETSQVPKKLLDTFGESAAIWNISMAVKEEQPNERMRFLDALALHNLEHDTIELVEKIGDNDFLKGATMLKKEVL